MKNHLKCPNYRVRLFLSVDLANSTAYKHASHDILDWIQQFRIFYRSFPLLLKKHYKETLKREEQTHTQPLKCAFPPQKWKTVGDEIVFCCTLENQYHLSLCMRSFIKALADYSRLISGVPLDAKGNAWTASFPTPNYIIPLKETDDGSEDILPSEREEQRGDTHPYEFDFLGKEIDSGFRIARNSSVTQLTISPALGELLCDLSCKEVPGYEKLTVYFDEMQSFKGVAGNHPYPVLYLNISRDDLYRTLISKQRYLLGNRTPNPRYLRDFLHDYLIYYGLEEPQLPLSQEARRSLPDFYKAYKNHWSQLFQKRQSYSGEFFQSYD